MWKLKNPVDKWNRLYHHWKEKKLEHIYIWRNYTGCSIGRKTDGYYEQWVEKYGTEVEPHLICGFFKKDRGFPGGSLVVNSLPANVGDMGSIPGRGRSHRHWGSHSYWRQPRACASWQDKPLQWEPCASQESSPCLLQLEKSPGSNEEPAEPK